MWTFSIAIVGTCRKQSLTEWLNLINVAYLFRLMGYQTTLKKTRGYLRTVNKYLQFLINWYQFCMKYWLLSIISSTKGFNLPSWLNIHKQIPLLREFCEMHLLWLRLCQPYQTPVHHRSFLSCQCGNSKS